MEPSNVTAPSAQEPAAAFFCGLMRRRMRVGLTWRGRAVLFAIVALVGVAFPRGLSGFLAVQDPVRGGVLVMEGWVTDEALAEAAAEYARGGYAVWCVTGEPLEKGSALKEHHDYATLTVAAFEKAGGQPGVLHPVVWETVRRDRTYASALALKAWLQARGLPTDKVNVLTSDMHARRSRLLYEKAFGPGTRVGVIGVPDSNFDSSRWWETSLGVRAVVDETVAYVYARCFFRGR